jgi:hypothetical protein
VGDGGNVAVTTGSSVSTTKTSAVGVGVAEGTAVAVATLSVTIGKRVAVAVSGTAVGRSTTIGSCTVHATHNKTHNPTQPKRRIYLPFTRDRNASISNLSRSKNLDAKAQRGKELKEKKPKKPLRFFHSLRSLRQIYLFFKRLTL